MRPRRSEPADLAMKMDRCPRGEGEPVGAADEVDRARVAGEDRRGSSRVAGQAELVSGGVRAGEHVVGHAEGPVAAGYDDGSRSRRRWQIRLISPSAPRVATWTSSASSPSRTRSTLCLCEPYRRSRRAQPCTSGWIRPASTAAVTWKFASLRRTATRHGGSGCTRVARSGCDVRRSRRWTACVARARQ